jgi:hypothetical protein
MYDSLEISHYLFDRAQQEAGHSDDVASQVGEGSPAAQIMAPAVRLQRVGHVILGVHAPEADDFAHLARGDHLAGEAHHRILGGSCTRPG